VVSAPVAFFVPVPSLGSAGRPSCGRRSRTAAGCSSVRSGSSRLRNTGGAVPGRDRGDHVLAAVGRVPEGRLPFVPGRIRAARGGRSPHGRHRPPGGGASGRPGTPEGRWR
jgi:hypothetical protein